MYESKIFEEQSLLFYKLESNDSSSWLTVCPERGGIITEFGVKGKQIFYVNEETLFDRTKPIRGGNPILFPISGRLKMDEYEWGREKYRMPIHGVARNYPWKVKQIETGRDFAKVTIQFVSNQETKKMYPFDFKLLFTYMINETELKIEQTYVNETNEPMPLYAGFHPYFRTKADSIVINSSIDEYFDFQDGLIKPLTDSIDKKNLCESVLLKKDGHPFSFSLGGKTFDIKTGTEFRYIILWTEGDKDYICVEPWMTQPNEMNRKEELIMVPSGGRLETFISIEVKSE